jgi:hypothetical protein
MAMLMPPAWENDDELAPELRAFFGPPLLSHGTVGWSRNRGTDGRVVGAALDRNGLRPARYLVTKDGLVVVSSEVGVVDVPADQILRKGRLGPGDIVAVDLKSKKFMERPEIHSRLAARNDYREWLEARRMSGVSQNRDRAALKWCDLETQGLQVHVGVELILGPISGKAWSRWGLWGMTLRWQSFHQAASALLLLQAAFRPGDESSH